MEYHYRWGNTRPYGTGEWSGLYFGEYLECIYAVILIFILNRYNSLQWQKSTEYEPSVYNFLLKVKREIRTVFGQNPFLLVVNFAYFENEKKSYSTVIIRSLDQQSLKSF